VTCENPSGHCWHERPPLRNTYRGGDSGEMTKAEMCCYCGKVQVQHFHLEHPEGHGRYAPKVWALDKTAGASSSERE
jgi:hypothetical protein